MNLTAVAAQHARVLSGMRPTGRLHLGHYHGVLKNWVELQHEYQCFFFVADWHALTTHYDDPSMVPQSTWDMVIDWLAAGVNPGEATLFVQSRVPEHAELHLLLSMITPLGWLERVPTYKDQQERLKEKDLSTYGFLGYPLLQSADILVYRAGLVPVGEDQVVHVELTREVARRFNHIYGREADFEDRAEQAIKKMGKKNAKLYNKYRRAYQEQGDDHALEAARALLDSQQNIGLADRDRLFGFLEGGGKVILPEPQPLLTHAAKMPGLDGQKMSKSYGNTIALDASSDVVEKQLRTMPTDPARVRRTDPGNPDVCPVWQFHQVYSDRGVCDWVQQGCRSAAIGCIECKQPVIDAVLAELRPMQERAREYADQPDLVRNIINEGCERAREVARETMDEVRHAMSLDY
jgi:tryptophanyl-tRNA synthetase